MDVQRKQIDPLDERLLSQAALNSANDILLSLCVRFSPTFVAVERRDVRLDECLDSLLAKLDDASDGAVQAENRLETGTDPDDTSSLSALAERHRLRRRTLLQHGSLLELLELPALMDACLRAGLYDEALAVAAFGNTLERRHSVQRPHQHRGKTSENDAEEEREGGEEVILSVVSSLRSRENDLRHHLLSRLRGSISMPHCLEIVTALRRLNGVELERKRAGMTLRHSSAPTELGKEMRVRRIGTMKEKEMDLEQAHSAMEMRLMVDFFEARDSWLRDSSSTSLNSVPLESTERGRNASSDERGSGQDSELLLNTIDRIRTRTFEVATQFLAIFCGASSSQTQSSSQGQPFTLLSMWLSRRVQCFLSSLESQLVDVDNAASLRDVLDATNFFASSMGRVGADFQCLLPPIFEDCLVKIVLKRWSDGVNSLEVTLKVCREAGLAGPLFSTATTSEVRNGEVRAQSGSDGDEAIQGKSSDTGTPSPPRKLLASPPLARFINAFLDGLNEARRCLLPGSSETLRRASFEVFTQVDTILQANERVVLAPGLRGEAVKLRDAAARMRRDYASCAQPYLKKAVEISFGSFDRLEEERRMEEERLTEAREKREQSRRVKQEAEEASKKAAMEAEKQEVASRLKHLAGPKLPDENLSEENQMKEVEEELDLTVSPGGDASAG